jgi:hypothetical protein
MDVFNLITVLGVLLVFGLIVYLLIRSERRRRGDRNQIAESLGFEPLERLDHEKSQRLITLHQHSSSQEIKVENAAQKDEARSTLILFDLVDHSGDSVSTLVDAGIAVFSKRLALPRFSLMSRVAEKGRLAEIANRFLEILVGKRKDRIILGTHPQFDERYFLFGEDKARIRALLDEYRQSRLSQSKYRHIEADGDSFTYSRFVFAGRSENDRKVDLKKDLSEVQVLLELLSSEP